jgi:hypothetical protein
MPQPGPDGLVEVNGVRNGGAAPENAPDRGMLVALIVWRRLRPGRSQMMLLLTTTARCVRPGLAVVSRQQWKETTMKNLSVMSCSKFRIPAKHTAWLAILIGVSLAACGPIRDDDAEQVESEPPSVSYDFETDNGLLEANSKARAFCSQYASTPSVSGTIIDNPDGTNTVKFDCITTAALSAPLPVQVYPAPPAVPRGYVYRSETELLAALQSADMYCDDFGKNASTSIATNADGTRSLSFQCVN